uniref:Putative formyltetrahydrofolate dehydrogenase n=1 Tax=Xenopsylla cheopis TaxID=163159 RepID=A0A6M2DFR9_XENCH
MYLCVRLIPYNKQVYKLSRNMSLLKQQAFINNDWVQATSGNRFDVLNPANNKVVGTVPNMNPDDAVQAIEAASKAFQTWQDTTAKERSQLLRRWYDLMQENKQQLAEIMTSESGKPISEALGEVNYGNSFVEWFSEQARRIDGEIIQSPASSKQILLTKQPIGVVAMITPWNFPHAMITRKAAAALAAGCTCVIKPAEDTPLTALALAQLAQDAGIPKGVINVVTCDRAYVTEVGKVLCEHPKIAALSFTGSTEVGKTLYQQCAKHIKRVGLELGGNAPFIVFSKADLDKAVAGAMASKFRNCGQTCVSANTFLIQKDVFEQFVSKMKFAMHNQLVMGDGKDPKTTIGPLVNEAQARKIQSLVNDALNKGAEVVVGGKPSTLGPLFYEPTLLTHITKDMNVYNQEIFGPVVVCIPFETEEEAITIANNSKSGLAGYFYSSDIAQAFRVAKKLEVGMVGVNEGIISTTEAAFGGIKESGFGREGSKHGCDEYLYIKYTCFGGLSD